VSLVHHFLPTAWAWRECKGVVSDAEGMGKDGIADELLGVASSAWGRSDILHIIFGDGEDRGWVVVVLSSGWEHASEKDKDEG
jgi:hypothetical protein